MVSSSKSKTTKLLDYMDLIINYLKKRRVGGFDRDYTGILFVCVCVLPDTSPWGKS